MKPRLCDACPHAVGLHSHIPPHVCNVDKCNCWGFARPASIHSAKSGNPDTSDPSRFPDKEPA